MDGGVFNIGCETRRQRGDINLFVKFALCGVHIISLKPAHNIVNQHPTIEHSYSKARTFE